MHQLLPNIHNKIRLICKPNPKIYPDPSIQQLAWSRNLMNFYSLLSFFIIFAIFFISSCVPLSLRLSFLGANVFQLITLTLFCRSRVWIFNIFFIVSSILVGFIPFYIVQEISYFYVGATFLLLASILMMTGDLTLTILFGIIKMIICLTTFRDKLAILIRNEEPEIFAEKFVKNTLFYFVIVLIVNIILVKTLEKRTIELSNAKMAIETALEQQKTVVFSFSHELRNPINSLLGNLQLVLQGEALSSKAKEMLNIAKVCGEILLHNINNVLDTGKNDIGKLEIHPVPTQLNELFQRTWGIYSELFRQKKLKSQLRVEKKVPSVVSIDSHKVNQILLNLIGNSIKFTEKGSISVTIKCLKCENVSEKCFEPIPYDDVDEGLFEKEENLSTMNTSKISESRTEWNQSHIGSQNKQGVLKIIVKDTGSGMKPEALERLFQKFSQVSEDISQRNIGTGLGLFITKEICHAMNGEIRAYSKFGKGTTFVVCIPTVSAPMNLVQRAGSGEILSQLSMKHLKALVADDSPFNVNLILDYFAKFEASIVSVAYNGYDIFQKYQECKANHTEVHIVTLDIDMPIWDGRKVCDRIREYERQQRLKPVIIILISGNYDKEQIEEYLDPQKARKADFFLRKPVSFSEFHRAVYSLVNDNL